MGLWADRVLPGLIEKACRSGEILEERQRWVPRTHGRVLELGVGTGLNLAFYDPTRVEQVVAIDPSAALLARAQARATAAPVPVELRAANAEALPFAAASFDSVLVTYSLCSIDQLGAALGETRRVVRPGGDVIFVEHGRAPDPGPRRNIERHKRYFTALRAGTYSGSLFNAAAPLAGPIAMHTKSHRPAGVRP